MPHDSDLLMVPVECLRPPAGPSEKVVEAVARAIALVFKSSMEPLQIEPDWQDWEKEACAAIAAYEKAKGEQTRAIDSE